MTTPVMGQEAPKSTKSAGLGLGALIALAVGSMIGGGIFSLPGDMAGSAAPGPVMIGWLITGVGMLALALVFQSLANKRPDVDGGVYGYAREGFGPFVGFTSAWGYWLSAWIGNVAYLVLLFSTASVFFPAFEGGNSLPAIIGASVLVWLVHFLVLRGVREAAGVNTIVTIAKVVPIVLFVVVAATAFKADVFTADFWGAMVKIDDAGLGSSMDQIKNMMMLTVWVFIGIEGAAVFSSRARNRSDVGKATVLSFVGVLALLMLVNLLSFGVMAQAKLAGLEAPSMGHVLADIVGPWGLKFVALGLIVSLLGALLSWTLLCAEILDVPSREGVLPAFLSRQNAHGAPAGALWMTNLCIQALLVYTYFDDSKYLGLVYLATSLILLPYLWSALFHLKETFKTGQSPQLVDILVGVFATVYALWLVYAGGLIYLLVTGLAYLIGLPFYLKARAEKGQPMLTKADMFMVGLLVVLAIGAIVKFQSGALSLNG